MQAPRERPRALALGIWLACRGAMVVTSLVLAALGTLGAVVYAFVSPHRGTSHLATTATLLMAWSVGVTLAFGAALRAVTRDWQDGIIALARLRGVRATAYVRARVGGLVVILALTVGGAALAAGIAGTSAAKVPLDAARDMAAALAYALAFAATLGPVAMAALGARSRAGGYLALLGALVLPELCAPWTKTLLPRGWQELTSIPSALAAVMSGVEAPRTAGLSLIRAILGLAAVVAVSLVIVRARIPRVMPEGTGDST